MLVWVIDIARLVNNNNKECSPKNMGLSGETCSSRPQCPPCPPIRAFAQSTPGSYLFSVWMLLFEFSLTSLAV